MSKLSVNSLMSVLKHTVPTETGVAFPGEHMPSGNPVTADGISLTDLMKDGSMVQQWHDAVRSTYEREKDERDQAPSAGDTPDLVIRGSDRAAEGPRGGAQAAPTNYSSPEAALREASASGRERLAALDAIIADAELEYRELQRQVQKIDRALEAFEEVEDGSEREDNPEVDRRVLGEGGEGELG